MDAHILVNINTTTLNGLTGNAECFDPGVAGSNPGFNFYYFILRIFCPGKK